MFRIVLFAGILTGFMAMSTVSIQMGYLSEKEVSQQQDEKDNNEHQEVVKSFDAITPSFQLSLNHTFALIDVLPEVLVKRESNFEEQKPDLAGSKVLKILFRRIISPNAP